MTPIFSLCHATARLPHGWRPAYEAWRDNCSNLDRFFSYEYILAVDTADRQQWPVFGDTHIIHAENTGRQCAVDGWNTAGKASTGKVLITVADDCFPPPNWDLELIKVIPNLNGQYAVEVSSGTSPADDEWMRCMLHSIITRPYYERIGGNFFDPRFQGMYADVWFTDLARHHGVVIDARHLTFQHLHWIGTNVPFDEIYQRQNARQRYDDGMAVLGDLRREAGIST